MTNLPDGELVAILQRRGLFNPETMMTESFPGACQVTVHGSLEEGEDWEDGLLRECEEELGPEVAEMIGWRRNELEVVVREEGILNKETWTYAINLPNDVLKQIRWHSGSGGMQLVRKQEVENIVVLTKERKQDGVPDLRTIALFLDEKDALRAAFGDIENIF